MPASRYLLPVLITLGCLAANASAAPSKLRISNFIQNATLNQKSPKTWCDPLMAGAQAAMDQFMQKKEIDWTAHDLQAIRFLHLDRRKLMKPRR